MSTARRRRLLCQHGGEPFRGVTHLARTPEARELETSLAEPDEPLLPAPLRFFRTKTVRKQKPTLNRKEAK